VAKRMSIAALAEAAAVTIGKILLHGAPIFWWSIAIKYMADEVAPHCSFAANVLLACSAARVSR